ncbi:unnamed protein product [Echinostoma caproni]|uniref:Micronuclear linker histone polyprotein-like n=1 Tax=Echinostoma caproni TaxID=27848 RepID=A0A183AP39_9TREM|nr:unnamed protein product [Echinostoma caproni]
MMGLLSESYFIEVKSMNPLSWFPFYNEEKQGENFDGSLLVPLTVGLVSVVSSVLVGYRSGLLTRKQAASLIVKQVEEAERSVSLVSSRDMTKRKSASKNVNKPNPTVTNPAAVPTASHAQSVSLSGEFSPSGTSAKQVDGSKQRSTQPEPVPHIAQAKPPDTQARIVEDNVPQTNVSKSISASGKRNKKTKHSNQSRSEPEASYSNGLDPTEPDMAWVVVTSKKVKQSTTTVSNGQPTTKVAKKKTKISEGAGDIKIPVSTQAVTTKPATDVAQSPSGEERKSVVKFDLPSEEPLSQPSEARQNTDQLQHPSQPTAIPADRPTTQRAPETNQSHNRVSQASTSAVSNRLPATPDATVHAATAGSQLPDSHMFRSLNTSLPATLELLTQHLSSQVSAKELECQLLRDEVIRLREEVGNLKHSSPNKPHVPPPSVDAETMTVPQESPAAESSKSKTSGTTEASSRASSATPRSDSPDTVLLLTLQKEIERLAREMKLSQQRNENLEARLATANKQISAVKSENAKQLKVLNQELGAQTQRAQQSEETQRRMDEELREALQQLECTRRKAEQWERERAILVQERDQLTKEREALTLQHQACLSELESVRHASEELQTSIREAELRAQSLERDRSVVLGESHTRIAQLEAQLSASQEQEQTERTRLQTVESSLTQLRADTENLRQQLAAKEQELQSWREKCESLEQNLSELSEQCRSHEGASSLAAETIQSVSDTKPVAASALTLLAATTQTDPEPGAEFESELSSSGANGRVSELEISKLNSVAISPIPRTAEEITNEDLKAEVAHYKSALNVTESVLAELQNSVDEEAERWRKALDASRMECEVLEEKLTKTESSLSVLTEERDRLLKKLDEASNDPNYQQDRISVGRQSIDDDRSSVQSLTVARMLDSVRFDETTPKPELIRLLNKFRYLIQVEHEALKNEQSTSSRLQSELEAIQRQSGHSSSVSEGSLNGALPQPSLTAGSKAARSPSPTGFPTPEAATCDLSLDQTDHARVDGPVVTTPVSSSVLKSTTAAQNDSSTLLTNGLHSNDSTDASSIAP